MPTTTMKATQELALGSMGLENEFANVVMHQLEGFNDRYTPK